MSDIENGQHWLDRNRPPRVQITYDVEIGDAVQKKELPLVVGILAQLDEKEGLGDFNKKAFLPIDRDNFNEVLRTIEPTVTVGGDTIHFTHMDQFHPLGLVRHTNLPGLKAKYEERQKLRDMLAKLDGNLEVDQLLKAAIRKNLSGAPAAVEEVDDPTASAEQKAATATAKTEAEVQARLDDVIEANVSARVTTAIAKRDQLADAARAAAALVTELDADLKKAEKKERDAEEALQNAQDPLRAAAGKEAADPGKAADALKQLADLYAGLVAAKAGVAEAEGKLKTAQETSQAAREKAEGALAAVKKALEETREKSGGALDAALKALGTPVPPAPPA